MVILVGGAGYTGKTFMAQRLLEKLSYPYLSIDHLKMGLYRADAGCGFTPYDGAELIGERLWPILRGIIMVTIENRQNLIIEGAYLLPQKIRELGPEYLTHVIALYLGFSKSYIENRFEPEILRHRCVIEARGYEHTGTLAEYLAENERQRRLCEEYGGAFFEISGDYWKETEQVCAWVESEVLRRG